MHEGVEHIVGQLIVFEVLQRFDELFVFKSALPEHLLAEHRVDIFSLVKNLTDVCVYSLFKLVEYQG